MQIVNSQIHIWEDAKMSPQHRQIPTYSMDDALKEMGEAGVDAAVIHPPSTLGEKVNELAVEAVRRHPDKFCILGHFDLQSPDRENIVKNWRQRPGHARLPLHVQPATPAKLVDRRLARLVLGGLRKGEIAGRASGRRTYGRFREDRRAPSRIETAHRPHGPPWQGRRRKGRRGFCRSRRDAGRRQIPECRAQAFWCAELFEQPYPYRNIHRYIRQMFDAFGPQRCFWGTDITRMPCSYRQCVTMFTEELPWLQGRDKELVMGQAVCDWLGWKRPA